MVVSLVVWPGLPDRLPGIQVAGSTLDSSGGGHHAEPSTRQPTSWPTRICTPWVASPCWRRDVGAGPGGLPLSAAGSGRAWPRCPAIRRWRLTCEGGAWRGWLGRRTVGQDWFRLVPVAVADRLGGGLDGYRAAYAFFRRTAAAAAGRGEADPGGAGGGGRGVPAVGQQPRAGHQPDRAQ